MIPRDGFTPSTNHPRDDVFLGRGKATLGPTPPTDAAARASSFLPTENPKPLVPRSSRSIPSCWRMRDPRTHISAHKPAQRAGEMCPAWGASIPTGNPRKIPARAVIWGSAPGWGLPWEECGELVPTRWAQGCSFPGSARWRWPRRLKCTVRDLPPTAQN